MNRSERMSSVDATWLRMDRPANLMMIVAVWLLEGPVALDKVEKQLAEGFLSYRRFRQKVEYTAAGVLWRDDPNFDLSHHIKRVRLPGRGGKQALERFVGELASEPLDPNRPLWTEHIVEDYEGGAALVFRGHHAIADGMAPCCCHVSGRRPRAEKAIPGIGAGGGRVAADLDGADRLGDQRRDEGLDIDPGRRARSRPSSDAGGGLFA